MIVNFSATIDLGGEIGLIVKKTERSSAQFLKEELFSALEIQITGFVIDLVVLHALKRRMIHRWSITGRTISAREIDVKLFISQLVI